MAPFVGAGEAFAAGCVAVGRFLAFGWVVGEGWAGWVVEVLVGRLVVKPQAENTSMETSKKASIGFFIPLLIWS